MNLADITPLILTHDEAPNIGRVLDRLAWARRIVVVDGGSRDETLDIVAGYPQAHAFQRPFDTHSRQWNFGLDQVRTTWVLALDADYVLSEGLVREVEMLRPQVDGYAASFRYCIDGRALRGTLYPPRVVLFRTDRGRYRQDGHTQRIHLEGRIATLRNPIYHDDRKPLARWLRNQLAYARLEAEKLRTTPPARLGRVDRLRRKGWIVPWLTPFYCLFGKRLILDGRAGLTYTLQRTYAEVLLVLMLLDGGESREPVGARGRRSHGGGRDGMSLLGRDGAPEQAGHGDAEDTERQGAASR